MRSFLILLCLPALGFSQIKAPRIGLVRYADSTIRAVYGLPASFIVGPASMTAVDAASFSDSGGILSSEGKLRIVTPDGAVLAEEAGSKTAIVEISDSLGSAIVFLPESNTLIRFDGKEFQRTQISAPLPGSVLSLRLDGDVAFLLTESNHAVSEVTVALSSGNLLSENYLSGVQPPAAYMGASIVYSNEQGLTIEAGHGALQTLPFACARGVSYERMAGSWLQITCESSGQQWALQVSPKRLHLSELPQPRTALILPRNGARP